MTTKLALAPKPQFSLAPTNFEEAWRFSEIVAKSAFAPKNFIGKPGDVFCAIQMGAELGLSPMQALQNIAPVNGKPSLYGDAVPAVCMGHPDFVSIKEDDLDQITKTGKATCVVVRRGLEPVARTFSVADAKTAKLWGKQGPWSDYPSRMLQMRARGFACRDAFPDALRGIITREEAQDIPVEARATVVEQSSSGPVHVATIEDPINQQLQREIEQPAPAIQDPESYVIRSGKNAGRKMGELPPSSIAWYASEDCKNRELREAAQAVLTQRIELQAAKVKAEMEEMTKGDAWGMDPDPSDRDHDGHDEMGKP